MKYKILKRFCASLIKADVNSWDERVNCDVDNQCDDLLQQLQLLSNEIQENDLCDDSREASI